MRKSVTTETFFCDRCKEEVESLRGLLYTPSREELEAKYKGHDSLTRSLFIGQQKGAVTLSELCPKCWDALIEFLKPKQTA